MHIFYFLEFLFFTEHSCVTNVVCYSCFRYCMVLFAGIAAEALVYGEAEGGENDENLFRNIWLLLEPPLSLAEMPNQA
ncbi:hypothetical protein S83_038065 [Arachis hypogaea]